MFNYPSLLRGADATVALGCFFEEDDVDEVFAACEFERDRVFSCGLGDEVDVLWACRDDDDDERGSDVLLLLLLLFEGDEDLAFLALLLLLLLLVLVVVAVDGFRVALDVTVDASFVKVRGGFVLDDDESFLVDEWFPLVDLVLLLV